MLPLRSRALADVAYGGRACADGDLPVSVSSRPRSIIVYKEAVMIAYSSDDSSASCERRPRDAEHRARTRRGVSWAWGRTRALLAALVTLGTVAIGGSARADDCPADPNKTAPGACGCGYLETNPCSFAVTVEHYDTAGNALGSFVYDAVGQPSGMGSAAIVNPAGAFTGFQAAPFATTLPSGGVARFIGNYLGVERNAYIDLSSFAPDRVATVGTTGAVTVSASTSGARVRFLWDFKRVDVQAVDALGNALTNIVFDSAGDLSGTGLAQVIHPLAASGWKPEPYWTTFANGTGVTRFIGQYLGFDANGYIDVGALGTNGLATVNAMTGNVTLGIVDPNPGVRSNASFADDAFAGAWANGYIAGGTSPAFNWGSIATQVFPNGGNTTVADPDPVLEATIRNRGDSTVHTYGLMPTATWNPSTQGPIKNLSVSYDIRLRSIKGANPYGSTPITVQPSFAGNAQFAIEQGGVIYAPSLGFVCPLQSNCNTWRTKSGSWNAVTQIGALSNRIGNPGAPALNLANGGPIRFGIVIGLSGGSPGWDFDYIYESDNFLVTLEVERIPPPAVRFVFDLMPVTVDFYDTDGQALTGGNCYVGHPAAPSAYQPQPFSTTFARGTGSVRFIGNYLSYTRDLNIDVRDIAPNVLASVNATTGAVTYSSSTTGARVRFVFPSPDSCPNDPSKTEPGVCGCGTPESYAGSVCNTGNAGPCAAGVGSCSGGAAHCDQTYIAADSDETCDGIDDDCNGAADEAYLSLDTTCGVGACAATGATSCTNGSVANSCTAGTAAASDASCNGIDDDCDGAKDEDFASLPTTCGLGECATHGTTTCLGGVPGDSCVPLPAGSPSPTASFGGIAFPQGVSSFADEVIDFDPFFSGGPRATHPNLQDPAQALGAPDWNGDSETGAVTLGNGGRVTLRFRDNALTGSGTLAPDLHIFEVGGDVEATSVEISRDGVTWISIGQVAGATASLDIDHMGFGPADAFKYVRLTDDPNQGNDSSPVYIGADIDAVGAIASLRVTADDDCNGLDDDCDGTPDDDFVGTETTCGTGACAATGATSCENGGVADSCTAGTAAASDASCNNVDDDCNGHIDDGYVGTATSCGVGDCAATGLTTCVNGATGDSCAAGTAAASDTTCDGIDDDCNGVADDSDGDHDATPDCGDGCATDPAKIAPGQCGCFALETDSDADDTADCNDGCPQDALKLLAGSCGCGTADDDVDGDLVLGCHDDCPTEADADQADFDADHLGDACDPDDDNDGVLDTTDNCHFVVNGDQENLDGDALGDICDPDIDGDGILNGTDNCPLAGNGDQLDTDADSAGDACDTDDDNDNVPDTVDSCPLVVNADQLDSDTDGPGDACDDDDDNDGVLDSDDVCPLVADPAQTDSDADGYGNLCDDDDDNDGVLDLTDNCQFEVNPDQLNDDVDLKGDDCDLDDDNDGVLDTTDNCHFTANPNQQDRDGDEQGDVCDNDDDGDGELDADDNCPSDPNVDQHDNDDDGLGDVCDDDDDNDTLLDVEDNCPTVVNLDQLDLDQDNIGDVCDNDRDGDGVLDVIDNCPVVANSGQGNLDSDAFGDACDSDIDGDGVTNASDICPLVADPAQVDLDGDGDGDLCDDDDDGDMVTDVADNCPRNANTSQADLDQDGLGDACDNDGDGDGVLNGVDNCPTTANSNQANFDHDGLGDACDQDDDNDGIADGSDNCPYVANAGQANLDGDLAGDACDNDIDGDLVNNAVDNCPYVMNAGQADLDGDLLGDACDGDVDGDGIVNGLDNCPTVSNSDQANQDGDGYGNACDGDIDGDGRPNVADNCPTTANANQANNDGDSLGDVCDPDDDNDGRLDTADNCPLAANANQANNDGDSLGDVCDPDDDDDGAYDTTDNCPIIANAGQTDTDGDGMGNSCDPDDDNDAVLDADDNCPLTANTDQNDADDDDAGDLCDGDDDNDGVGDTTDTCPGTPGYVVPSGSQWHSHDDVSDFGEVDPGTGCTVEQLCPCEGPLGTNLAWNNHGAYVSCVTRTATAFRKKGLITQGQKADLTEAAAHSDCGTNLCNGKPLKTGSAAPAPYLVFNVASFQSWGPAAPTSAKVYAGTTRIYPNGAGDFIVPLLASNGTVIVDAVTPAQVQSTAGIPKGAFFVLRRGAGAVVQGFKGYFPSGSKTAIDVSSRIVNGVRGNEKNVSFEHQGNGFAILGKAGEDEFWKEITQIHIQSTVTTAADLVSYDVCRQ